jgi:hypothetical protein
MKIGSSFKLLSVVIIAGVIIAIVGPAPARTSHPAQSTSVSMTAR